METKDLTPEEMVLEEINVLCARILQEPSVYGSFLQNFHDHFLEAPIIKIDETYKKFRSGLYNSNSPDSLDIWIKITSNFIFKNLSEPMCRMVKEHIEQTNREMAFDEAEVKMEYLENNMNENKKDLTSFSLCYLLSIHFSLMNTEDLIKGKYRGNNG